MTIFTVIEYPKCLSYATDIIYPDENDFERAIDISRQLYQIGKQIGAIDILIASICINRNLKLKSKDNDFSHIKKIEKNFQVEIVK